MSGRKLVGEAERLPWGCRRTERRRRLRGEAEAAGENGQSTTCGSVHGDGHPLA